MSSYRTERDSMGEIQVPAGAYYGAQTQRAVLNFPISGLRLQRPFIRALGLIKRAAAETNLELNLLDGKLGAAIVQAANEVIDGRLDDQFVVDVFQTGSGTSTNMNCNEVIANRAMVLLGGRRGSPMVHPNDHVNRGQSSNDVIPTAIHVSSLSEIESTLIPALVALEQELAARASSFDEIVKIGRTHLQDAVPIRLGQEFSGYAAMLGHAVRRSRACRTALSELAIGGTAVGTGLNCHREFPGRVITRLSRWTGLEFRAAQNRFEALASRDAVVEASGNLKAIACSLLKIANDIRWLGSGPRCGIGEIRLPATQPGSSIMPGKVNPVMAEALAMVAVQVIANDTAITLGGQSGNFELNVMQPMMAYNLLQSIELLARGAEAFRSRCIQGLEADRDRCREMVEQSLAMVTALVPVIGYDRAAGIAKEAYRTGKTIRNVAEELGILDAEELNRLLDPRRMTEGG